jgi:hypothetical protein
MLKLTRIYEYVCLRIPPEKIADLMGLSLGYTRKLIQELTGDFSVLVQNDEAKAIIADNIAKFDLMIHKAMSEISDPRNEQKGRIRIDAINAVADIVKKKADYEVLVGVVRKAPNDLRLRAHAGIGYTSVNMEELRDEISKSDLDSVICSVADAIREKKDSEKQLPATQRVELTA